MPRLFALDRNFPTPIVEALQEFQFAAELVRIDRIDPRMALLDDWELLVVLHQHERPWDGLITTDSSMLQLPRELAAMMQTKLTVVVAEGSGHDPVKATGLLFAHLGGVAKNTDPDVAQVWRLRTATRPADDPWKLFSNVAQHQNVPVNELRKNVWLDEEQLTDDPLARVELGR